MRTVLDADALASNCLSGEKYSRIRIPELDGLRGIAILVVIIKHYGVYHWPWAAESAFGQFVTRVFPELHAPDLFLVLTGFLLGGRLLTALDAPCYYSGFYFRRVCRTFPLYYVLLLVFTVGVLARDNLHPLLWLDVDWPFGTPWSLPAYVLFLQSFWIAARGYLGSHWLGITWTLAVQEQFYFVLPWILRCAPRHRLGIVLSGLFLMAPVCRLFVVCGLPTDMWYGYDCLLCCRSDTLCVGVLAAWVLQSDGVRKKIVSLRSLLHFTAAVLFLGLAFLAYAGNMEAPAVFVFGHSYRAIMYLVLVFIVVFASNGFVGGFLRVGVLRELGRISYGLYLFHQMIRDVYFRAVFGTPAPPEGWERWLAALEAFTLTIVFAELCWHYVERPLIAWSKSK